MEGQEWEDFLWKWMEGSISHGVFMGGEKSTVTMIVASRSCMSFFSPLQMGVNEKEVETIFV